jgi:regulator of replication initiation timing
MNIIGFLSRMDSTLRALWTQMSELKGQMEGREETKEAQNLEDPSLQKDLTSPVAGRAS